MYCFRISLIPNLENSTFFGTETIRLQPHEDTSEITFHVQNISINEHSISIRSIKENSSQLEVIDKHKLDGSKYRIVLGSSLDKNELYDLDLNFTGHLNNQLQGFYKTGYTDGRSYR